ncbi:hypothetical protein V6N11_052241 [Hibiscus sabdariffa]|uniref:Uncharacterized protein n=1 Tax=Hibiscus sabdariffa TaxID=183260 RepID=A0ABR2U9R9_9ROSI
MVSDSINAISWEDSVHMANGNHKAIERERVCEVEQTLFFSEFKDLHCRRKFISLSEMQDRILTVKNKKKRDRALKKYKKVAKKSEFEVSCFHVPNDSDIARNQILTKLVKTKLESMNSEREKNIEAIYIEARETVALSKSLGMKIVGNEKDVVEEMIRIELQNK